MSQQCQNCGAHVTEQFARVLGGNDDTARACPECATVEGLFEGAAAKQGERA